MHGCKQGSGNEEESGEDLREKGASLVWWRRGGMEWNYSSRFLTLALNGKDDIHLSFLNKKPEGCFSLGAHNSVKNLTLLAPIGNNIQCGILAGIKNIIQVQHSHPYLSASITKIVSPWLFPLSMLSADHKN